MAAEASTGALFKLRLAGFDVAVRPSFLLTSLLLGTAGGRRSAGDIGIWVGLVFVSVLWHELGHAFAGRVFGGKPWIELNGGGGLTFGANATIWWQELIVCLAGPFAGFILGGAALAIGHFATLNERQAEIIQLGVYVNIGWGLVNLVPVFPYDGGQAFRAFAVRWLPQGRRVAIVLSFVVATGGFIYALTQTRLWLAYLAGRGIMVAFQEIGQFRAEEKLDASAAAWRELDLEKAAGLAQEVLDAGGDGTLHAAAVERLAWVMVARGQWRGARSSVAAMPPGFACSPLLDATLLLLAEDVPAARVRLQAVEPTTLQLWTVLIAAWLKTSPSDVAELVDRLLPGELAAQVPRTVMHDASSILFYADKLEESAAVSARAFEGHGVAADAYNVACSASRLGHPDHALVWLEKSINAGWSDRKTLEADPDLAAVRAAPGYAEIVAKMKS